VSGSEHRRLLAEFTRAARTGDLVQLEQLLAGQVAATDRFAVAA
jgi:hypothetical protein